MPTCTTCGLVVERKEQLSLVRNDDGRWIVVCPDCAVKREEASPPAEAPSPEAPPAPAEPDPMETGAPNEAPPPSETPGEETAEEASPTEPEPEAASTEIDQDDGDDAAHPAAAAIEAVRETLREIREEAEAESPKWGHDRRHERHDARLRIEFSLQRDDRWRHGEVLDISRGGLRFQTDHVLRTGDIIRLVVRGQDGETQEAMVQSAGEVRRVEALEEDWYEVGVRFVQRSLTHASNRRKYRRYEAQMTAYYTRSGANLVVKGEVVDVSQGGVCMVTDELVERGESLVLILRGEGGPFLQTDLRGSGRVVRVRPLDGGRYELGVRFIRLSMHRRDGESGTKKGGE